TVRLRRIDARSRRRAFGGRVGSILDRRLCGKLYGESRIAIFAPRLSFCRRTGQQERSRECRKTQRPLRALSYWPGHPSVCWKRTPSPAALSGFAARILPFEMISFLSRKKTATEERLSSLPLIISWRP